MGFLKKHVFDFGILLLELITRKKPIEINSYSYGLNESLFDWITNLFSSSTDLYSVIDNSLIDKGFDGEIFELLRIACTCLNPFHCYMFQLTIILSTIPLWPYCLYHISVHHLLTAISTPFYHHCLCLLCSANHLGINL